MSEDVTLEDNYDDFEHDESEDVQVEKKSAWFKWLLLAMFTTILAGGYYLYQEEFMPIKNNIDKLRAQLSGGKIKKVESTLNQQADVIADLQEKQNTQTSILQQNAVKLNAQSHSNATLNNDLSDIQFLLEAADDRVYLLGDVQAALRILQGVSEKLLLKPGQQALHSLIKEDIERLSSYQPLDVEKTLFPLTAQVVSLQSAPDVERAVIEQNENSPTSTATSAWGRFQHAISKRIQFIEYDQKLNAINYTTINQHKLALLKLRLETLRLMLVRQDMSLFKQEVSNTSSWVSGHFDVQQAAMLTAELNKLSVIKRQFPPRVKSAQSVINEAHKATAVQEDQAAEKMSSRMSDSKPEAESFTDIHSTVLPQDSGHMGLPTLNPGQAGQQGGVQ